MGHDDGLDRERSDAAMQEVKSWRRSGRLPFPRMSAHRIEELAGTLDYPPYGSPDTDSSAAHVSEETEPLSAERDLEESDSAGPKSAPERR
jgi:MscS family membrane protein